jgi:hypothetical protein
VQGAAGALESLGRTIGPVWGNAVLQGVGEGAAYGAAAGMLVGAAALARLTPATPIRDAAPSTPTPGNTGTRLPG